MSKYDILKKQLPNFVNSDPIIKEIQQAQGEVLDSYIDSSADLLNQFFVDTATWGLNAWEVFVGLPISSSMDSSLRKRNIKAQIQSGAVFTESAMRSLFTTYGFNIVEIMVGDEPYDYVVKIDSSPEYDVIAAFCRILKKFVPAHINFIIQFNDLTSLVNADEKRGKLFMNPDETVLLNVGYNTSNLPVLTTYDSKTLAKKSSIVFAGAGTALTSYVYPQYTLVPNPTASNNYMFALIRKRSNTAGTGNDSYYYVIAVDLATYTQTKVDINYTTLPFGKASSVCYSAHALCEMHWNDHTKKLIVVLMDNLLVYNESLVLEQTINLNIYSSGKYVNSTMTPAIYKIRDETGASADYMGIYAPNDETQTTKNGTPVTTNHLDVTDPRLTWTAGWTQATETYTLAFNNTPSSQVVKKTTTTGAAVKYEGTWSSNGDIIVNAKVGPDKGKARIYVDGNQLLGDLLSTTGGVPVYSGTFDCYSPSIPADGNPYVNILSNYPVCTLNNYRKGISDPLLKKRNFTVWVECTGDKNPSSSGTNVTVAYLDVDKYLPSEAYRLLNLNNYTQSYVKSDPSLNMNKYSINRTEPRILVGGTWLDVADNTLYEGAALKTNLSSSFIEFSFIGRELYILGKKGTDCGLLHVQVDMKNDAPYNMITDCFQKYDNPQSILYHIGADNLDYAYHTVKIWCDGSKNAAATDSFIYLSAVTARETDKNIFDFDRNIMRLYNYGRQMPGVYSYHNVGWDYMDDVDKWNNWIVSNESWMYMNMPSQGYDYAWNDFTKTTFTLKPTTGIPVVMRKTIDDGRENVQSNVSTPASFLKDVYGVAFIDPFTSEVLSFYEYPTAQMNDYEFNSDRIPMSTRAGDNSSTWGPMAILDDRTIVDQRHIRISPYNTVNTVVRIPMPYLPDTINNGIIYRNLASAVCADRFGGIYYVEDTYYMSQNSVDISLISSTLKKTYKHIFRRISVWEV